MKIITILLFTGVLSSCDEIHFQENTTKLLLMPEQGKMHCNVVVKNGKKKDVFALTIPETIGCKEGIILNFPSATIKWIGPDNEGIVSTGWIKKKQISYSLMLIPHGDFVDSKMTIKNLSDTTWNDVWSFNCLSPTRALKFNDSLLTRTYMSTEDGPCALSNTVRFIGPRPTIGVYFNKAIHDPEKYSFINEFRATSTNRTNGNYLVTISDERDAYMAATTTNALFLFNNTQFKCIHVAPNFGKIEAGKSKTMHCKYYFAKGTLDSFITRYTKEIEK